MKPTLRILITTFMLCSLNACGQSSVSLSTGLSVDVHNARPFYNIPVIIRWSPFKRSKGFFLEGIKTFGLKRISTVDAYTANPQLPAQVQLKEALSAPSFGAGAGGTILIYTGKKDDLWQLTFSAGVSERHFRVKYNGYDQANYEVMNPDVDTYMVSPYLSIAANYDFPFRKNRMFIMIRAKTAEIKNAADRYPYSYKPVIPVQLTCGYRIVYN